MKLRYAVVFEQTPNNFEAYSPNVPGCVGTGKTWKEIKANIREAPAFHIEGMVENGEKPPEPRMSARDAMVYHSEPLDEYVRERLAEYGEPAADPSITVEMVEIEVALPQATTRGLQEGKTAGN